MLELKDGILKGTWIIGCLLIDRFLNQCLSGVLMDHDIASTNQTMAVAYLSRCYLFEWTYRFPGEKINRRFNILNSPRLFIKRQRSVIWSWKWCGGKWWKGGTFEKCSINRGSEPLHERFNVVNWSNYEWQYMNINGISVSSESHSWGEAIVMQLVALQSY